MTKSATYFLMIAFALSFCFITACGDVEATDGKTGGGAVPTPTPTPAPVPGVASKVFGDCTVTGNMAYFEVKCTKEIKNIQMGGITAGKALNLSNGGKKIKIDKIDPNTLRGRASGHTKLDFRANHTDGSSSDISFGGGAGGKVLLDCTVTGNVTAFEVKCPKEIENFQMGSQTYTGLLQSVGGKTIQIDKKDANTLKGSSTGHTKLDFKVNHTNGSSSYISIK